MAVGRITFWASFFSLLLCVGLALTTLRAVPEFLIPTAVLAAVIIFFSAKISQNASVFFLGASICVVPVLGAGALNLCCAAWLLGFLLRRELDATSTRSGSRQYILYGALCLIVALSCATLLTLVKDFDRSIISSVWGVGGFKGLHAYLAVNRLSWHWALVDVGAWGSSLLLMLALIDSTAVRRTYGPLFSGIAVGAILAVCYGMLQIAEVSPLFGFNRSPFFISTLRYPLTFSDPNAFGLMVALLAPVLFFIGRRGGRYPFRLAALGLFILSFWSGSRTMWVGFMLWYLGFLWLTYREKARERLCYAIAIPIVLFGIIALLAPMLPAGTLEQFPTLRRLAHSVEQPAENTEPMFLSRQLFTSLGLSVWKSAPLSGVGLRRFYDEQVSVARMSGVETGGWRDNANNFYLGIAAEQGLVGVILFALAFVLFVRASRARYGTLEDPRAHSDVRLRLVNVPKRHRLICGGLLVLAVLLLSGPHLAFDEVRMLAAVLLSCAASLLVRAGPPQALRSAVRGICGIALASSVVSAAMLPEPLSKGFYGFETSANEATTRWSAKRGAFTLCDLGDGDATIFFQAQHPDLARLPLQVTLRVKAENGEQQSQVVELRNSEWLELDLAALLPNPKKISIETSRVWSPRHQGLSGDARALGVRLQWPAFACEQP